MSLSVESAPSVLLTQSELEEPIISSRIPEVITSTEAGLLITRSVYIIISSQSPRTGLYPAARPGQEDKKGHYDHSWVRDGVFILEGLINPRFREVFSPDTHIGLQAQVSSLEGINGLLNLFACEPWRSAFLQDSSSDRITTGIYPHRREDGSYKDRLYRTFKQGVVVPPIHFQTDGSACEWATQNQPDCWGEFLSLAAQAINSDLIKLTDRQIDTLIGITKHLIAMRPHEFMQSSMWEHPQVGRPPLSSVAFTTKGLEDILPIIDDYLDSKHKGELRECIDAGRSFIGEEYPNDYTNDGHVGTDFATIVAMAEGALPDVDPIPYFKSANERLRIPNHPTRKRHPGDLYFNYGQEAGWLMSLPCEALVYFQQASNPQLVNKNPELSERLRLKGMRLLRQAIDISYKHGYYPELFFKDSASENLLPNKNDLLWTHALMIKGLSCVIIDSSSRTRKRSESGSATYAFAL